MKKFLRFLKHAVAHLTILFGGMFVVFFVTDQLNEAMEFLTSDLSKACILVLALLSIASAAMLVYQMRREDRPRYKQKTPPPKES